MTPSEPYLTMAGLRERGWTDAMIREYLREPDDTRPNPRYASAAPMKLYLAEWTSAAHDASEAAGDAAEAAVPAGEAGRK